nr:hypothetical protein [Rhodococcus sp. (in: high G+C Gram-positive bacteria)]
MTQILFGVLAACALVGVAACGSQPQPAPSEAIATAAPSQAIATAAPPTTAVATSSNSPAMSSTATSTPAATAVDPADFSADGYGIAWESPTGKIWCRIAPGEYGSGCQSYTAPVPDGADCVSPTFTIDQLTKGFYLTPTIVLPTCFNQGVFTTEFPKILPYDMSVTTDGYTCTSRETGMTCTTPTGHGFEMSMQVARSF